MTDPVGAAQESTVGLGKRAARGAAVTLSAQGAKILIQVASVVVLARLLDPRDYGLIAMVMTVIGVGELLRDFGLSSAAIQAPQLSRAQRDNLFWTNTGIGIVLAVLVFFFGGELLALIYRRDELIPIARALSLVFILNGLTTQYRADLVRRLRFRQLALADILSPALGLLLAIGAALLGWGFWALVVQQVSQSLIQLTINSISARWIPGLPQRNVPMRAFLKFGWHLVASQLIGYVSNNTDSFIIGLRFGTIPLGLYSRAYQLLTTPLNQIRLPLTTVALPVLSRLRDDNRRFADYIAQGQLALGYTVVLGLGLIAAASFPVTAIFLGPKWESVAPIFSLLSIAGIFQLLAFVGYWVYVTRGLTGALFRFTLLSSAIKVAGILIGSQWGVVGVAAGYVISAAVEWPISLAWLSRRTDLPVRRLYAGAFRILTLVAVAGILAALVVDLLAPFGPIPQLGAALLTMLCVYALACLLVRPIRKDIVSVINLVKLLRRTRGAAPETPATAE
ncbi:lipopolysaccharide biosynthesis protein [Glaciihabitans sp. UYNi722]|uniref:lipopolysaccharide biosynthesis protein n=1 Tax=Glaciihabitans sp. UYNi722 TaxID=3156344 RepID=UPI0033980047